MDLLIPVNFLKPSVSLVVQIFSGRDGLNDGSGSGEIFFTAPQPSTGPGHTGVEFIAGAVGAQDGIFSIGISSDQAEAALLTSAPLATASAFVDTCFPPFCPTVTIAGVEFSPVPEATTFLLVVSAVLMVLFCGRRQRISTRGGIGIRT